MKNTHSLVLALSMSLFLGACSKKQESPTTNNEQSPQPQQQLQQPANIANFDPLSGDSLVVAANREEFNGVILTLKYRDSLRARTAKMTFLRLQEGLMKVVWNVRRDSVLQQAVVWVVDASSVNNDLLASHVRTGQCRIVALRGHTGDMERLQQFAAPYMAQHCFTLMGGCNAVGFLGRFYTPERPILGDRGTAESANNTYLLVRSIDLIGGKKVASWQEFADAIMAESSRAHAQSFFPGQALTVR